MPSKKKKKNPPVKSQFSQKQRQRQDSYDLVKKVVGATIVSSVIMLSILAWYATSFPGQNPPGGRLMQLLPPFVGLLGALTARAVRDFFHGSWSETIYAALVSGVVSLVLSGLIVLLS